MNLIKVENLETRELLIYKQMRDNAKDEQGSFIADSPKVVNLLLESDLEIKSILATREYYEENKELISSRDIPKLYVADKKLMESIVGHKIHHNVMMHGIRPKEASFDELDEGIIMLDDITSTENVGSIARSAAGFGVSSYLVPKTAPHPYGRRALRVSMGYVNRLKVHVYEDIFETLKILKAKGYTIFGAEITKDSLPLSSIKVPKKWVLLMGHEGKGLSEEVIKACDYTVQIEMAKGIKSFNVGVAASVLLYAFTCKEKK